MRVAWEPSEDALLQEVYHLPDWSIRKLADKLDRTESSIASRAYFLELSRPAGVNPGNREALQASVCALALKDYSLSEIQGALIERHGTKVSTCWISKQLSANPDVREVWDKRRPERLKRSMVVVAVAKRLRACE